MSGRSLPSRRGNHGRTFGLFGVLVIVLGLLMPSFGLAHAAETPTPMIVGAWPAETLTYGVKLNGAEVGRETVTFRDELNRVIIHSRAEFTKPVAMTLTTDLALARGSLSFEKYAFEAALGGTQQKMSVTPTPGGIGYHIEAGGRTQEGKVPVATGFLVLDNSVAAHYNVLIRRYLTARETQWTMLVPQVLKSFPIKVTGGAEEEVVLGGITRQALHLKAIGPMALAIDIWADRERQVLLKLAIPAQKYEVSLLLGPAAPDTQHTSATPAVPATPAKAGAGDADATLPAGIAARDVVFRNGDVQLAGTLTFPKPQVPRGSGAEGTPAQTRRLPTAILVHGSGPQDRNENSPVLATNIFRDIAHYLSARGVAVLRYDKRGIGQSTGNAEQTSMSDLVSDIKAAVAFVRSQPEVDPRRVVLIGHSEGGILAPMVAAADPEIAGVILLAGAARPLDKIITDQVVYLNRLAGATDQEVQEALNEQEKFYALVRSRADWGEVGGQRVYLKWFREHFQHDPSATIAQVKAPVLILQGEKDFQVPRGEAVALGEALDKAGHRDHKVVIFPNLDHLFMYVEGASTMESYLEKERHIEPVALQAIGDWLDEHGLTK